ncbi:MAG: hypothetical protein DMF63_13470 [Acidobacteria bacterium]|nr:MAG: hypothetical protein DMF63_13470 [Acidobacteriota bacterium]
MNISYNWLKNLIDIDLSAEDVASELTRVGLAVEGVHPHGDDFVLDIDLTSNRPDCLSHLGVAREIAAITGASVKAPAVSDEPEIPLPMVLAYDVVAINDPELCHRFTARVIKNVKIGPSPAWIVERLEAIGERSINNVADITNYVMHELGQPMHSFDNSMLVIADAEKPAAIGGIMGGLDSSITEATTNVLLEVAFFKRENIRQTSRKLGLTTEASYRFERGVDIDNLSRASDRAAELICEFAGGEMAEFIDVYPTKAEPRYAVSYDLPRAVERLTGLKVAGSECLRILNSLGISQSEEDPAAFTVPSWRYDISIEEDLVEEITRHTGYENIAEELPPAFGAGEYQDTEIRKRRLRRTLIDLGFNEAITYSFIDTKNDERFEPVPGLLDDNADEKFVTLQDSVIEGAVRMRPTLLAGVLDAAKLNFNQQHKDLKLFEIGKTFATKSGEDGLPTERELLSLVITGGDANAGRSMTQRELDFYDAKGAVEAALEAVGLSNLVFSGGDVGHLRSGQAATISSNDRVVGSIGRISEELAGDYKFKQPVYVAELDLQSLLHEETSPALYRSLPKYPAIVRDVSFLVNRTVTFDDIRASILSQGRELCRDVSFVDVYEGKGIEANERSLTIRLEYRSDERTLIETEVDAVHAE